MLIQKLKVDKIATLSGHSDCVYALACAGNPSIFYSSGADGMVAEWNQTDTELPGKLVAKIPSSVYALAFHAESNYLLVGQNADGLHAIDILNKREVASVSFTKSAIFDIKISDGFVFTATADGALHKFVLAGLKPVSSATASTQSARCISVINANTMAVGYSDNCIRIIDSETLEVLHTLEGHGNSVFALATSPDGKYLISGSRDAKLKVWDIEAGYMLHKTIAAHTFAINDICYSPDGENFVTCSMDKSVKIWDSHSFSLLKVIDKARHAGHGTSVNRVRWTGYNNNIISCSDDRTISVWNIN